MCKHHQHSSRQTAFTHRCQPAHVQLMISWKQVLLPLHVTVMTRLWQVVMGREFHGEAFKPTPAVVLFKDFEVGQSYSQVITLTNISLARNTFKASHHHCRLSSCGNHLAGIYMAGIEQHIEQCSLPTPYLPQYLSSCLSPCLSHSLSTCLSPCLFLAPSTCSPATRN